MKRLAILSLAVAAMGAGCWSSEPAAPVTPVQPPVIEQPQGTLPTPAPVPENPAMMPSPTSTPENPAMAPTPTPKPTPPKPPVDETVFALVEMSENGFKPAQLTIKKNTIVRFKNVGQTGMWPASGPHPNHTDYQDFDARRTVKPGEVYEFRFKNVGTWSFHDHLSPGLMGRIVVQE
ncbi:cupredoxin domain-containing protein [Patescibacteria group bacterium]|nr:cupredoxin domain-containing protein [Patescibacteria group bacterium]MBP9709494.1 cupredoxin domain-containing protein [Patescibacteria group bacterium]